MNVVDWGNVPTWISAVGTTGALSATVGIIWRDHRKAERADAAALSCWEIPLQGGDSDSLAILHDNIHVQNNAARPVYDLVVLTWSGVTVEFGPTHLVQRVLRPGECVGAHVLPSADPLGPEPVAVAFRDSDGAHWLRDLSAQTLHPRNVTPSVFQTNVLTRSMDKARQRSARANARMAEERHSGSGLVFSSTAPPWRWPRRIWTLPRRPVG